MKPVVLLSGGLDSAVCLAMHPAARALYVNYGQPHAEIEGTRAKALADHYGTELAIATVTLPFPINTNDPAMVVPGRNLILISLAAAIGQPVIIGANADDRAMYVDCRKEFFDALNPLFDVITPLIDKTKPEIGMLAEQLDVPTGLTWSCYYPQNGMPCNACDACQGRENALSHIPF